MATPRRSKHSSPKRPRRGVIVLLLVALVGTGGYLYLRLTEGRTTVPANGISLQTATATNGDLVLFASGTGSINPAVESSFGFKANGQVSGIDVNIGDHVEAGQVLARLDDTDAKIDLARAREAMDKLTTATAIAAAKQALAEAQMNLAATKKSLEHLISPEVLYWEEKIAEREQILTDVQNAAQTDPSDVTKQKAKQAGTALKFAQDSLAYFQKEYTQSYIPETFTQVQTTRGPFGARTVAIKVEDPVTGNLVNLIYPPTEGEVGMARAAYNLARASLAEAQTYFDILNGADVPKNATGANLVTFIKARDALMIAEYHLKSTELIAPIGGTVTSLTLNAGDLVSSGNSVITVSNLDQPYSLDGYLDAEDWGQIKPGYEVDVTFDILPDLVFKGTVTTLYPTLNSSTARSALVRFAAQLDSPMPYDLPSGAAAGIDVVGGRTENAVLVPVEALHEFGDGQFALFVMENGKPRLRVVEVGLKDLTKAVITSGLSAGEVVTTGVVKTR